MPIKNYNSRFMQSHTLEFDSGLWNVPQTFWNGRKVWSDMCNRNEKNKTRKKRDSEWMKYWIDQKKAFDYTSKYKSMLKKKASWWATSGKKRRNKINFERKFIHIIVVWALLWIVVSFFFFFYLFSRQSTHYLYALTIDWFQIIIRIIHYDYYDDYWLLRFFKVFFLPLQIFWIWW